MRSILVAFTIGCLLSPGAFAEHEADHRYNVRGYLLNADQGLAGVSVQVFDGSSLLASTDSDSDGYFSLHLHLHNSDLRKRLRLLAGGSETEIRVSFDPGDSTTTRTHDVNLVDGKFIEGSISRFRLPPWVYPLVGISAIVLVAVALETRRKRKIRAIKKRASESQAGSSHKSKKKRKKR